MDEPNIGEELFEQLNSEGESYCEKCRQDFTDDEVIVDEEDDDIWYCPNCKTELL